jgi:hypothetical protein
METKLTLRLDEGLIEQAKGEARRRGSSLSRMVADYFKGMVSPAPSPQALPPITASLIGVLPGEGDRSDYRKHLEEKYR